MRELFKKEVATVDWQQQKITSIDSKYKINEDIIIYY